MINDQVLLQRLQNIQDSLRGTEHFSRCNVLICRLAEMEEGVYIHDKHQVASDTLAFLADISKAMPLKFAKLCTVLRPADLGDCTNGGISSYNDSLTMVINHEIHTTGIEQLDNCVALIRRYLWGKPAFYVAPIKEGVIQYRGCMGGNWLYSCNSAVYKFPHPFQIHDRFE